MADRLTDDEISALIDGEASADLSAKAQDAEAAAEVASAQQTEAALRERLYRWECPSAQQLGDYVLKRLPAFDTEAIAKHLDRCVRCRAEIETLTEFLGDSSELADSPPRTMGILRRSPRYTTVRQVAVGAMRGEDDVFSQVLERETFTLFLEAQPAADGVLLTGQIVVPDAETQQQWTGALIELRQAPRPLLVSTINDVGEFRFRGLDSGTVEIAMTTEAGFEIWLVTEPLLPGEET